MEPWQSWTALVLGGGAAYYYYASQADTKTKRGRHNPARPTDALANVDTIPRKGDGNKNKRKKQEKADHNMNGSDAGKAPFTESSAVSSTDTSKARKRAGRQAEKQELLTKTSKTLEPSQITGNMTMEDGDAAEELLDNKEFAKQLAGLKAGINLSPPPRIGQRQNQRTVKTSQIDGVNKNAISTASSTTGADGDDDLSPHTSPELVATTMRPNNRVDVSDMLEAPTRGPSVLRILPSTEPPRTQNAKVQKLQMPTETKKQRQNRRKTEEMKAAREEDEKVRRVLLEKQLRTAREAEGRPAKNGLSQAKPPVDSAWTIPKTPSDGRTTVTKAAVTPVALLDTFQSDHSNNGVHVKDSTNWERDLPSEEEQMRMINESTDVGWSTVAKGKKGKKTGNGTLVGNGSTTGNESSENGDTTPAATTRIATVVMTTAQPADSDWSVV